MTESAHSSVDLWAGIAGSAGAVGDASALALQAERLGELITPALAQHLVAPLEARLGAALIDPGVVAASRLVNRFNRGQQAKWARVLAETGRPLVYLKGFAAAHCLYPDPDLRTMGDLDVLLFERDVPAVVEHLRGHGFRFAGAGRRPWGFVADASFAPFVSPDGNCSVDIHRHPDSYPAHRSLTTDMVFDAAITVMAGDLAIRVPCREHMFLLAATNSAKDKFGPFSVRQVVDALAMLTSRTVLDWRAIEAIAQRGRYLRPLKAFCALVAALGLAHDRVPADLAAAPEGARGREFARLLGSWRGLFPNGLGIVATLRREMLLCAEPTVGLRRNLARIFGLMRPRDGVPRRSGAGLGRDRVALV
jgi:hypothetical protein